LRRVRALDQLRSGARRVGEIPKKAAEQASHATVLPKRAAGKARRSVSRAGYRVADTVRSLRPGEGGTAAAEPAGDGILDRARANPRLAMAIVGGALLLVAWIGWAIYVTSSNGAEAGLGVVIAWPALLAALCLIALPFVGGWFLVQRLRTDDEEAAAVTAEEDDDSADETDGEAPDDEGEDSEGDASDEDETEETADGEKPEDSAETKAKTSG
jgi:hypothetical protein